VIASIMSQTFNEESLKKISLTSDEAMQQWSDRHYTPELDEELEKMFFQWQSIGHPQTSTPVSVYSAPWKKFSPPVLHHPVR